MRKTIVSNFVFVTACPKKEDNEVSVRIRAASRQVQRTRSRALYRRIGYFATMWHRVHGGSGLFGDSFGLHTVKWVGSEVICVVRHGSRILAKEEVN